jgi:hypothetical protein
MEIEEKHHYNIRSPLSRENGTHKSNRNFSFCERSIGNKKIDRVSDCKPKKALCAIEISISTSWEYRE